jgi:hypothetical protein
MFLGHFGLAMAAKKVAPRMSLGTTMLAAQFLDASGRLFVLAASSRSRSYPASRG